MNGAVEEGGKVATSLIEGLKTSPLVLALIVLNIIFIGMVTWASMNVATARDVIMKQLIEQNAKAQDLLSRCIVPKSELEDHKTGDL